jgi:hypothetical protein
VRRSLSDLIFAFFLLLAIVVILWVTVAAVRRVRRGENPWKAFKMWLVRVTDVLFGIG